ncbi:urease accessory protein UreE [Corynebacterium renale]|uniref:Urease accessory protein UreE n=1 Tax=Corynebacterium renale TaxID=1724 RepID=A0A2A9DMB4_9CORY|nr:urease accessory protein UreE [Corynebacterium renale]PFG27887.1 urease accessory protein [Corynebacterium renale]SQG63393.1 urease accessory protein UreE [Corynebacterium renale]SQI21922.1 urease accessory protein UreE [Corynebacterium renale]STC99898.1 urease accessory protein UreE [Corynebacterium renale]
MLITEIQGNIKDLPAADVEGKNQEFYELPNLDLTKRIQRGTTTAGREIGLRLGEDFRELYDGDILYQDEDTIITVKALPTDVIVIKPKSIYEMGTVAHGLGNRHLQAQFFDADSEYGQPVMVVQYDHTVEHFLDHAGTEYSREDRVMPKAFRHAEHSH